MFNKQTTFQTYALFLAQALLNVYVFQVVYECTLCMMIRGLFAQSMDCAVRKVQSFDMCKRWNRLSSCDFWLLPITSSKSAYRLELWLPVLQLCAFPLLLYSSFQSSWYRRWWNAVNQRQVAVFDGGNQRRKGFRWFPWFPLYSLAQFHLWLL